jgi:hypothetical protein
MKIGTTLITVEFVGTNVWVFTTNHSEPRHQTALDLKTRLTRSKNGSPSNHVMQQRVNVVIVASSTRWYMFG